MEQLSAAGVIAAGEVRAEGMPVVRFLIIIFSSGGVFVLACVDAEGRGAVSQRLAALRVWPSYGYRKSGR